MKKFYNQSSIKIEEFEKYQRKEFNIDISDYYGFNYYEDFDKKVKEFMDNLKVDASKPILFTIKGDFDLIKEDAEEDIVFFEITLVNLFITHMINKEVQLDREYRLGIPKSISGASLGVLVLKDLINKKIRFPIFNVEIVNLNGDILYEVF